jgi:hypothetical protein
MLDVEGVPDGEMLRDGELVLVGESEGIELG